LQHIKHHNIMELNSAKTDYLNFLEKKKNAIIAFDFQKTIIEKAIRKGRIAIFADTGLGRPIIRYPESVTPITQINK